MYIFWIETSYLLSGPEITQTTLTWNEIFVLLTIKNNLVSIIYNVHSLLPVNAFLKSVFEGGRPEKGPQNMKDSFRVKGKPCRGGKF